MVEITTIIITGVEVLLFLASSNKDNSANFSGEESTIKLSGVSIFFYNIREKIQIKSRTRLQSFSSSNLTTIKSTYLINTTFFLLLVSNGLINVYLNLKESCCQKQVC